jgi:putative hydrolase of the HAD superfamily
MAAKRQPHALVLSDLGGVVVEFDADKLVHHIAQLLGRTFDDVHQAVYSKELLLPFEVGRITPEAYYEGLKARLQLTWTYPQFVRFWNDIFIEIPATTAILRQLRRHHRVVALSNTNTLHLEYIKRFVLPPDLFHDWIGSCDVGCRKPDPKIYELALARENVPPHEVLYIDDRPEMVAGGKAKGLNALLFRGAEQLLADLRALGVEI